MLKKDFRDLFESQCGGRVGTFARRFGYLIGLNDLEGNPYRDAAGNATLKNPKGATGSEFARIPQSEFGLRMMFESLVGEEHIGRALNPSVIAQARNLMEDNGAGATQASAFANINAFTAATAGLLEVGILEQWQMPEFIGDVLAPPAPSRMFEGKKFISISRLGDQAEERIPGMPTKRAQTGQRWITQPRTVENALACEVTQEAVFLDLTAGEVMEQSGDVGGWLAYRKEIRIINAFIGVTNTYTYKDTSYDTWISNGYFNNDLSGNDLQFPENVITAEVAFRDMIDPETNTRVQITPNTLICQKERRYIADVLTQGQDYQARSSPGATSGNQTFRTGPNPIKSRGYEVHDSALIYQRLTDADGLNLSATAAASYWWLLEKGKFMVYAQNWPLRVQTATPNTLDMIDRGVVLYVKADERGIPMIMEPRRGVRSHT